MKKAFIVLFVALLTGCAGVLVPSPSTEDYNRTLSLWTGKELSEVVQVYGVPDAQLTIGETVYHKFVQGKKVTYEMSYCEVTFATNKENVVTRASLTKNPGHIYQNIDPCFTLVKPPKQ